MSKATRVFAGRACGVRRGLLRLAGAVLLVIILMSATDGVALGVVGGRTVRITAAPWTVLVKEYGQPECTGVIIGPSQILTAGHCVMSDNGNSAKPLAASDFRVEAGVSNFQQPLASGHPQFRAVSVVRAMPGYIAASKLTPANDFDAIGHDLAVLTLSRPLDLDGDNARAASLPGVRTPIPKRVSRLVMAGFGAERAPYHVNGTLNEVVESTLRKSCGTKQVLCIFQRTSMCFGDSGSGAIEAGPRPTVLGIFSEAPSPCRPGLKYYAFLASAAALGFVEGGK